MLWDKVLTEVARDKTMNLMWEKLESLYMIKYFPHRLCLKQQLYSFSMVENKSILEKLIEFYKIINDLENIKVKIDDDDKAKLLLNSLPISCDHFKDVFLYGKESIITLDEVQMTMRSNEFSKVNYL